PFSPVAHSRYLIAMQLRGCGTALVTPFHQDGSIDDAALRNLVAWQIESGIDFLVPCGTTGETPTLTHDEWLFVTDTAIEVAAGRVPIVAGATSNSTQEAVERAKELASRAGIDYILTANPYYNKPTQEGQYRHFKAIAEAVDKPIILYNVPGRTAANLEAATLARLAEIPNIVAVKEASGNMTQIAEMINSVPDTFAVLSGDDAVTLPVIALGGVGVISVASNEIPHEMAALTRAALENDWPTARTLQRKYLPLMQANFIESSPMPVKAVLAMMGKIEEVYRLPLVPMRRDTRSRLQKIAAEVGLISKSASPAADANEFFIYENWAAGPHKIVVHRSSCGQCSHGKGRPSGHDANHAKWHGPYSALAQAREAAHAMTGVLIRSECKCV
ncbi:MAG TPA: 4-hydroxy-tetrahydrodipicolinate synthase, partial [Candidatus Sulfotelmatobacter sp.]|nr:4-hydroxy-tetrahydrodipicolinate synthase [Candidatus Sulfotelmatobacter sp.]